MPCIRTAHIAAILALLAVAACSDVGFLDNAERKLGVYSTWYGTDLRIYHSVLFSPQGEALSMPGYVVGIEDVHRAKVPVIVNGQPLDHPGYAVTHVVRYERTSSGPVQQPMTSCVLYTMIDRDREGAAAEDPGASVFRRCRESGKDELTSGDAELGKDVERVLRAEPVTHIVLVVMGWNTDQTEALKNYNSIVGNLVLEAHRHGDTSFEPLVIGVTWPSLWKLSSWSVVPDAVVRGVSFPWISDAAEDIGQSVITFAIEDVLKARNGAGRTVPVTLIGHSFGAKVLMNAIKVAWDRGPGGPEPPMNALFNGSDRLILLEGAFEVRDLFDDRAGTLRTPFAGSAPRVTMTASAYDNAVSTAFWGWYAGDIRSFDQICRENPETWRYWDLGSPFGTRDLQVSPIGCQVAVSKGRYGFHLCKSDYTPGRPARPLGGNGFRYFDASELINCNEPFTGGDAHSDIYRAETARFLLDEMK